MKSSHSSLCVSRTLNNGAYGSSADRNGSPDEEINMNASFVDSQVEDKELKCQLLRKYIGYLGSLKQEFMKKRKKGKLPKEVRQQLLDWWTRHYKWPYPSGPDRCFQCCCCYAWLICAVAFGVLQATYFFIRYLFSSQTGHVGTLYSSFFAIHLAAGVPGFLAALASAYNTNLFGDLTHYSSGQAAVYYGDRLAEYYK